jgi:eukaryotic-like serine/threonine-protein kinase
MSEIRLGNFRVTETLGAGALSTIYKAVQEPLGRTVAIKALKTQIAPTSSFGEQLEREATILGDLAHPNVVLLLDHGRSASGRPYLVLEQVDGPSLQKVLAKKRTLPVPAALAIALGVVSALEHVHERGVVHRDLKPGNVLLAKSGVVKLIDFGIAQRVRTASVSDAFGTESITPSGRRAPEAVKDAFGTPAYMSPEQILGDFVDGRSDLFSVGVMLYEMLSGVRPFESSGDGGEKGGGRLRRDAPVALRERAPGVPRAVERMVMRLLEKAPSERYPTAAAVRERVEQTLRALTRDDPHRLVQQALVGAGFLRAERKSQASLAALPPPIVPMRRVLLGFVLVLACFVVAVLAIEGTSRPERQARSRGASPLELVPDGGGGLRVLATPWAHVKVDGQEIDTTPFARAVPLLPGKHFVTLVHPEAPPVEREVTIGPSEVVTLEVTMDVPAEDAGKQVAR